MTVLQNTVTEPDGTALDGWLDVALVGSPFRPGTQSEVLGPIKDRRFTGGTWSVDLVPGLYEVTQRRRDGAVHSRWTVQVPDAGSAWLADCLVTVPATPASQALLGIATAGIDAAGHLLLTYTDGSTVDAGAVVGPQGPPYTGSVEEFELAAVSAVEDADVVAPAGAWNFAQAPTVGGVPVGSGGVAAADITDSTTVGRSVLTAADAAAARTAIGAGTSSLAIGTSSTTAKAGNYTPSIADMPAGSTLTVPKDATTGFWPSGWNANGTPIYTGGSASAGVRPTARADVFVQWKGADPSPAIVSSGTGGMRNGIDTRFVTP